MEERLRHFIIIINFYDRILKGIARRNGRFTTSFRRQLRA